MSTADRPDFRAIKFRANGMLDPSVYEHIWQLARTANANVLEVGTAHGAATIAAALGLPPGLRVRTIDRLVGGSRAHYGDKEANEKIIRSNFAHFGVSDKIDLFVGDSIGAARELDEAERFDILILDADGMIDRDLRLFWRFLNPRAKIVIDDVKLSGVRILVNGARHAKIDQKQKLSALLVDCFTKAHLLKKERQINETWFGLKQYDGCIDDMIDIDQVLGVYHDLVFSEGTVQLGAVNSLMRHAKNKMPGTYQRVKELLKR